MQQSSQLPSYVLLISQLPTSRPLRDDVLHEPAPVSAVLMDQSYSLGVFIASNRDFEEPAGRSSSDTLNPKDIRRTSENHWYRLSELVLISLPPVWWQADDAKYSEPGSSVASTKAVRVICRSCLSDSVQLLANSEGSCKESKYLLLLAKASVSMGLS